MAKKEYRYFLGCYNTEYLCRRKDETFFLRGKNDEQGRSCNGLHRRGQRSNVPSNPSSHAGRIYAVYHITIIRIGHGWSEEIYKWLDLYYYRLLDIWLSGKTENQFVLGICFRIFLLIELGSSTGIYLLQNTKVFSWGWGMKIQGE